jgi:signal recognition particle subunit SRP54
MLDLQQQLESMEGLGSFSKIKNLIPGFSDAKIPSELLENQEDKMKKWKHIIKSMTREEIENPEIIEKQTTRIARIAKGAGSTTSDVRALLKQYKIIKEFSKSGMSEDMSQGLSQKQMMKLAKKFGKKMRI